MSAKRTADQRFERWAHLRRHGPLWFVAVHGVLLFGLPLGIGGAAANTWIDEEPFLQRLLPSIMWACIVGICFWSLGWVVGERAYRKWDQQRAV